MKEIPGSEFELDADLVLLALGFLRPASRARVAELGSTLDPTGATSAPTRPTVD